MADAEQRLRGSSPLARGLPRPPSRLAHAGGIIPARAGFTVQARAASLGLMDHPRSRGVYMPDPIEIGGRGGSSPLARGLRRVVAARGLARRIIPARAGFTRYRRRRKPRRPDHPRSRGVYTWADSSWEEEYGSSPLARGLPVAGLWTHVLRRIIPARAGFTQRDTASTRNLRGSSPLARGLLTTTVHPPGARRGSSPLARGLPKEQALAVLRLGIIPARAGFTPAGRETHMDHVGSSPLARGLPHAQWRPSAMAGIIPARAGFTCRSATPPSAPQDHPRSRGVYAVAPRREATAAGSSPLARGLPAALHNLAAHAGIIPARAGFTPLTSSGPRWP